MPPESDPHFKAAFAELHRQRCAQAPSVEAMRSRALRVVNAARPATERPLRVRWATAGACAVLLALGGAWLARRPPMPSPTASAQHVEQLLAAIEQQLDLHADSAPVEFPTDALLSQNQTDPAP